MFFFLLMIPQVIITFFPRVFLFSDEFFKSNSDNNNWQLLWKYALHNDGLKYQVKLIWLNSFIYSWWPSEKKCLKIKSVARHLSRNARSGDYMRKRFTNWSKKFTEKLIRTQKKGLTKLIVFLIRLITTLKTIWFLVVWKG